MFQTMEVIIIKKPLQLGKTAVCRNRLFDDRDMSEQIYFLLKSALYVDSSHSRGRKRPNILSMRLDHFFKYKKWTNQFEGISALLRLHVGLESPCNASLKNQADRLPSMSRSCLHENLVSLFQAQKYLLQNIGGFPMTKDNGVQPFIRTPYLILPFFRFVQRIATPSSLFNHFAANSEFSRALAS